MAEQIEKVEQEAKPYTMRKLCASDIAPMAKVISNIGVTEFTKCFRSDSVKEIIATMKDGNAAKITEIAGLQVVMELVGVIVSHIPDCEKDLFALLSNVSGLPVTTIKEFDLSTFTEMIIDFVKKPEFKDFIGVVSRLFK